MFANVKLQPHCQTGNAAPSGESSVMMREKVTVQGQEQVGGLKNVRYASLPLSGVLDFPTWAGFLGLLAGNMLSAVPPAGPRISQGRAAL